MHGTDVMEKKGKMSIPETEIEVVPSQPTKGQMNFLLKKHVEEPIEPLREKKKHSIYRAYVTTSHMGGAWDPSLHEREALHNSNTSYTFPMRRECCYVRPP